MEGEYFELYGFMFLCREESCIPTHSVGNHILSTSEFPFPQGDYVTPNKRTVGCT